MMDSGKHMPAHFQEEHRQGERKPDPEPPRHVDQFLVRAGIGVDHLGLQRNAADWARSRVVLPHLGVHRTGPDRAFGGGFLVRRVQPAIRVLDKARRAAGAAEIIFAPVMRGVMRGRLWIDLHPAYGIGDLRAACRGMIVITVLMRFHRLISLPIRHIRPDIMSGSRGQAIYRFDRDYR